MITEAIEARLWSKVTRLSPVDCWVWTGSQNGKGYGEMRIGGRKGAKVYVHRIAYEIQRGPIPQGLEIDHLCRNTSCVNASHLEAVDHSTNLTRGNNWGRRKTHCPSGHPYDEANTYVKGGRRRCRRCLSRQAHERYLNRKAA